MNDLKSAFRQLAKNPGLTAVAVLSLSLGIAANTTIFSFVNVLLLRPPPVKAPGTLWQVWRQDPKSHSAFERYQGLSYPGYAYYRDHNQSFLALAAFDPETPFMSWNRAGVGQSIQCQFVSGDFFDVCGVKTSLGRAFSSGEDRQPGSDPVVVVSHRFWKNSLGSDPQAVGRMLTVNGGSLTVVGVAPEGFTGLIAGLAPDLWSPFMMASTVLHDPEWHTRTGAFSLFGLGRLSPGVSAAQAEAELTVLTHQLDALDAEHHNRGYAAAVFPCTMIPTPFRGFVGAFTAVLMGAVFMVLLIACANAANLMLARAVLRRRELAVRAAVGASRLRLMRQLLTESVLLALLGGSGGWLLTSWFVPVLLRLTPPTLPIRPEVTLDLRVLAFTALVSLVTGMVFGFAPAWQGTRVDLAAALKDESPATGSKRSRFAGALVVGQIAVCLVLLLAGSLCLRSLLEAHHVALGFQVRNRVTTEINLKDYGYSDEQTKQFNQRFLERAAALPGIQSASYADYLPLDTRYESIGFSVPGHEPPPGQEVFSFQTFDVGPGYFATMGTVLLKGREFNSLDREGAPEVAIINQAMAGQFWPGKDPIGQRLTEGAPGKGTSCEIVGLVETGKYRTLGENPHPVVFRSRLQHSGPRSTFVAQVRGDPQSALAGIRNAVQELDPRLSLSRLGTLEQHLSLALFPARTTGLLLSVLGVVAMLLAVSGLFGVITYSVSQRTREIGIRMALGAQRGEIVGMVLRQGMKMAGLGVVLGLAGALAATRSLRSLLFGVSPLDPLTFLAVPLLLAAVALLACWLPARRATRVDPLEALRYE